MPLKNLVRNASSLRAMNASLHFRISTECITMSVLPKISSFSFLQNRIKELEEKAIQREEQHSKQMQEMKNAYERQYRKLSEFTDFVKRYFPYVEKLMPTINFLRDTLNFSDELIKKLCMFKEVTIKGKLYSTEFRQHFKTDGSVCSLKETSDGKFELKIDGVSHVNWFRRKKYEFMEALGLPTKR